MPLQQTILNAPRRVPVAGMALLQGIGFVLLTVTSAALIGKVCGAIVHAPPYLGAKTGFAFGIFFAVAGFGASVDEVAPSPALFIEWWFHSHLLAQLAIALAVLSYWVFKLTPHMHPIYCGLLAAFIGLPLSIALLNHLFPRPDQYQTVVEQPLSTYAQALQRANLLSRLHTGPGAMRRAKQGPENLARFNSNMRSLLRRFYGDE